ncbi:hypothetical protein A2U01_0075788, partial [Trifolium medium]|nr:hypothetical protein [Trifolium medium]
MTELFSPTVHPSEGDKQNSFVTSSPTPLANSPKTL